MNISSAFDGGNIQVVSMDGSGNAELEIRRDHQSDFYQWFHFRVTNAGYRDCRFRIANAADAAYVEGWSEYRACASYDRENWFRVDTSYDGKALVIEHRPVRNSIYYAYFAPYSMERHNDLIARCLESDRVHYEHLGHTLDGQDMDLLRIGQRDSEKRVCWFIARQHPGETMAEWWMEGFLNRLLDADDPLARDLLDKAVFYVVPNMNPDGSRRGHLRTNAVGTNLNRAWNEPSAEASPEVQVVRDKMKQTGVDFCLDVHGDEALPYNFIAGGEGIPGWSDRLENLTEGFKQAYCEASPDFQTRHGYPRDEAGSSDLRKCTDYVAQTFDCLSMTLEMPFKDTADSPDEEHGWSPARCRRLGAAVLNPLRGVLQDLR